MKRFLADFYCGGAVLMFAVALGFGAPVERAIGAGVIWPYHVVSVVAFAFWGVELP